MSCASECGVCHAAARAAADAVWFNTATASVDLGHDMLLVRLIPAAMLLCTAQDVVGLLVAMLNRPHIELLLLAVGFLRRLCVFAVSMSA